MKYHLVYGKNGHYVPVEDVQTEAIDQGGSDASPVTEVFHEVPITEITKTNERDSNTTLTHNAKKFRPFSIELYNEILHQNNPTTANQTELQEDPRKFKLPISNQYDPENITSNHKEERIEHKMQEITSIRKIFHQENNKKDKEVDIKDLKTARKIITERLEKAVSMREGTVKVNNELNIGNTQVKKSHNISQPSVISKELKQEKLLDEISDIPKSVKETVNIYEFIDTTSEINKDIKPEDNDRKLFLLQEIEESIEDGLVKKKSTIFENKQSKQIIRGRQREIYAARKVFSIGSETIQRIKRTAESRVSKSLLNKLFLYLTNVIIKLTRYLPIYSQFTTQITKRESISKRKLSSTDIVQLVLRKPKDLTQKMDTVISEFHSRLNINNRVIHDNRRAKSVTRVEETKNKKWLSKMDIEKTEQMKAEIKLATLNAARRMLGRRRSYHNLTDIENEKIDGLTYIAIVESHVYTNKNAIFDDYISHLKTQVNNVLEITDTNEMVATECIAGECLKYSNNQRDSNDTYTKTEDFQSKELLIDEAKGQRIDYVATVTVEHKPSPIIMEKSKKSLEINKLAINESMLTTEIQENEVKQISAKVEDRIEVNETKNLKEVIIPTPIVEEMDTVTHEAANQINESFNEVHKDSVEITELNEELPIVNIESKNLSEVQVRGAETIEEVKNHLHETEENEISCVVSNAENEVIAQEFLPIVQEIREVKREVAKETTYNYEELTVVPRIEIKSDISAKSKTVESLKSALSTCRGISEFTTNIDTAVIKENDEIEKENAITTIEIKEFENAQILAIATARLRSEDYDEVENNVKITEIIEELPTVKIVEDNVTKPVIYAKDVSRQIRAVYNTVDEIKKEDFLEDKAVEVVEIKEITTALKLNYANIKEINTSFNNLDIESFYIEKNEEFATSSTEVQELIIMKSICIATTLNIDTKLEESEDFEQEIKELEQCSSSEVTEEIVKLYSICYAITQEIITNTEEVVELSILKIEQEVPTSNLESKFHIIKGYCVSVINDITGNLHEVNNFETITIFEEKSTENIEIEVFSKAQSLNTEICHENNIPLEEVESLNIDISSNEIASVKEEEKLFITILPIATPCLTQLDIILIEADDFENECMIEENPSYEEEKIYLYLSQGVCIPICNNIEKHLEECNTLELNEFPEELPLTSIEENVFANALSICTSILDNIDVTYLEADILYVEKVQEEIAGTSLEDNYYLKALKTSVDISQNIELLLEESTSFSTEELEAVLPSTSIEPFVLEKSIQLCTSILNDINEELFETNHLIIEDVKEVEANVLIEVSKFILILVICVAAIEEIYKDIEECNIFKVDEIKEEICSFKEEPLLIRNFPTCISILEQINTPYNSTEVLEIKQMSIENADTSIEAKNLITILCICTSIAETIITKLDEVTLFNIDKVLEYQAEEGLEPQIFPKTIPLCTATIFILNVPVFEIKLLETEIFEQKTVSESLEIKDLAIAQKICHAIVKQDDESFNEVQNTSITYKVKEDSANLSYEDIQLNATYAVSSATAKEVDLKYDIAENYESNLELEQLSNSIVEYRDFTMAHLINNATATNEHLNLQATEYKESNFVEESAVIKIEPKHKNIVSIKEVNVSYEDCDNTITKARKKKNIKAISTIKDEKDTINIKKTTIEENFDNLQSLQIEELKENNVLNEQVIITEEPIQLKAKETVTKGRKKLIKQKASNAVYQESNIQSNVDIQEVLETVKNDTNVDSTTVKVEPIIENVGETTSVNIREYKEHNNEANVNIFISKTKAKRDETYQEMSYNLTLAKPQVIETDSVTNEDTLQTKRKTNLKQYHTEEFQDEFNLTLDQNDESGVTIQEITDSDDNIEDIINIENRNESIDTSLEFNLQSQKLNASKDVFEASTFVKRRNKENASNQEESTHLTIFKKEDVLNTPVIENYDELNSKEVNIYLSTDKVVGKTEIISSQLTDFESRNTKDNNKRVSKKLSKANIQSISVGLKKEAHKESIENGFSDIDINTKSHSSFEGSFEKVKTSSLSQSRTLVSQEFDSTIVDSQTKSLSLKTNLKREEIDQTMKTNESSPEIDSPTKPPTPLTDEYIFRLTAPLPKSRGTTPAPREPSPEIPKESIINQNLVPTIESVTIERVVYNPPLPTPPTSPVHSPTYTKPGLNGGMKRLPRYFKPGLRGGSDRPPIPKEEILEVRKHLSTLTSDINETLKNIERYKKIVETLKQEKAQGETSKIMEEEKTEDQKKHEENETSEQLTTENPINEQPPEIKPTEIQSNYQTDIKIELNNEQTDKTKLDIKHDFTNRIEEARIKSYNIKEITSFEKLEKECDNTGVVELAPDTAVEESIQKECNIITEISEPEKPEISVFIKTDKDVEESRIKVDVASDEQKTADEEVARVTELTIDRSASKETSPSETDTVKEAHVISLTRVLSSHMLREGLSPDCQKMKDKFENKKNVLEDNINEDRLWTTFLQKSTNVPTQTLGHFADLQNKFESQEPFTTKLINRHEVRLSPVIKPRDFNSSPIPWQERALADTLGASNIKELTPGDVPQFFIAIPTESRENSVLKSTVIPVINSNEEISNVNINKELNAERITEHTVDEIIQEAMMRVECLNIGDGKNRLIQLFLNNIKNIADSSIPVEDQINQMRIQLETLEQVPDIIRETFENVAEKLYLKNQKKEENILSERTKYQELESKVTKAVEISNKEGPQIIKETKVEKMQPETKGALLVKDKKPFAPQMQAQKPQTNRPQQKFGWMKPEPRPIKLFGGRRWRRPGEEYTEEQIAETILAHSELIHGKTMGINFMKYEKPPLPLDHLQHSEVFKLIHNTEQTPQKPVELLSTVISEADYRERCRSLSPCPPEYYTEY